MTIEAYLAALPDDRREIVGAIRRVILKNLDADYEEGMQYGMIGYYVPHRVFPAGYHCDPRQPLPFAALASQKNYVSLYLMCLYGDGEGDKPRSAYARWFQQAWSDSGRNLDMGKSCIRFKSLSDVPLDVIGEAIRRLPAATWIERYQAAFGATNTKGVGNAKVARRSKSAAAKTIRVGAKKPR